MRRAAGQDGAIDLVSVMAGAVVTAIIAAVAATTAFVVIPWAQDSAAQQKLSSVVVAQSVSLANRNTYDDVAGLSAAGILQGADTVKVTLNAAGNCYIASSKSASGSVFYITDADREPTTEVPAVLVDWVEGEPLPGDCAAAAVPEPIAWWDLVKPGNSQTVIVSTGVTVSATNAFCLNIVITGTTTTAAPWAVTVDTSMPPFYGRTSTVWTSQSITFADRSTAVWRIVGQGNQPNQWNPWNNSWNNAWASSAGNYAFSLCESSMTAPPDRPEAYDLVVAPSTVPGEWGGNKSCMAVVVTGSDVYPFYAGWATDVNMAPALTDFSSRGKTVSYISWSPNGSTGQTVTPNHAGLLADSYRVTAGRDNAIMGAGTSRFTLCLNGY